MHILKKHIPLLNYPVISRLALLVLFMIVFATTISFVYSFYINKTLEETQAAARQMATKDMRRTLKTAVQAMTGAIAEIIKGGENKEEVVRTIVNHARYADNGYFFAYSTNGTNIAHPIFPSFQGQQRRDAQDNAGVKYINELTLKALSGGDFVRYDFYKPGESVRKTKFVYAQIIPGTNFWLASGLYIDDINRDQQIFSDIFAKIHRRASITVGTVVVVLLIFVVIPVSVFMIGAILKPLKQLERELMQAQKMEAMGIFAGGIAHDFGNVLGAISSCAALALMDVPPDSPAREDLEHIARAAQRGKHLVRRIKNFSSKADALKQAVDLGVIVRECMDFLRTIIPASVEVRLKLANREIWVDAAPDQLLQIIMNLCTNAEQAMRGLKGVLSVELEAVNLDADEARTMGLEGGRYARLSVSDTGVGMKPVTIKRIFEPFYTTRKRSGGTGLGLSMTKSIVGMHGGTITIDSAPGKGSIFHVLLPWSARSSKCALSERRLEMPGGKERIMLLDDDADFVASLHKLFSRVGYAVTSCRDSAAALRIFSEAPLAYDLVITDQQMPKMNGTEFSREIKKIRGDIPVILCSGFEENGLRDREPVDLEQAGIAAFFLKPFDAADICRKVRDVLDNNLSSVKK